MVKTYFPADPLLCTVVVSPITSTGSDAETDPRSDPTPAPRLKQNSLSAVSTCDRPSGELEKMCGGERSSPAEPADNSVLQAVKQLSL